MWASGKKGASDLDYSGVSANDAATDVTGAELEDLTDSGATTLHTHPGAAGHSYVNRENPTVDFSQIAVDDYIDAQNDFHLIDNSSGDFVNDGVQVGDWVYNATGPNAYAQVTVVNSGTDLTLDANIFPAADGDRYKIWLFRDNQQWTDLDLSGIVNVGTVLARLKIHAKSFSANSYIIFRKKGETGENERKWIVRVAATEVWDEILVVPNSSKIVEYKMIDFSGPPVSGTDYFDATVLGWWA